MDYDLLQPQDAIQHGQHPRNKKAQAGMAGKQAKTTQSLNSMMALCHKSPTILECYQAMAKETSPVTAQPKQTNKTSKISQTHTGSNNKEMTDDTSMATCQITNASIATTNSNHAMTNQKKETNKTMFNPWKTITTMKQTRNRVQNNMTTSIKDTLLKAWCRIKWWNQAMGKGAKTIYHQMITTMIMDQLKKTDPTLTVYQFYTTDKNILD